MPLSRSLHTVFTVVTFSLLTACGGGGGGGSSGGAGAPAVPLATLSATAAATGSVGVSWDSVSGATSYRVQLDPTGTAGFSTISPDLPSSAGSYTLPVSAHLVDWVNARVRVQACNSSGCSSSSAASPVAAMLSSISYIKASNTAGGSHFGNSLAVSGDGATLVVGSPDASDAAEGIFPGVRSVTGSTPDPHGAVYVYTRDSSGLWGQRVYLKAPNITDIDGNKEGAFAARFGASVAVSADGSLIAVGAPEESSQATGINGDTTSYDLTDAGAVFVYARDTGGNWTGPTYIKASNTRDNARFGAAVSLSRDGNALAVGAPGEDGTGKGVNNNPASSGNTDSGAAYIFIRSGGVWAQQAYLKASNSRADALFGTALALSGDGQTLAVGSPGENGGARGINGNQNAAGVDSNGAVYVFTAGGGTWAQQAYVKPSNTPLPADLIDGFEFGTAVALSDSGDILAAGAPYVDSDSAAESSNVNSSNLGAVFVFKRTSGSWSQKSMLKTAASGDFANLGGSVTLSADGSLLAVGATGDASVARGINGSLAAQAGLDENGGVFVFALDSAGAGTVKSYVKASNTLSSTTGLWAGIRPDFGQAVSLSADGKRLAVGAPGEYSNAKGVRTGDDNAGADRSQPAAGAVYVY